MPLSRYSTQQELGLKVKARNGKLVVKNINMSRLGDKIYPGDVMLRMNIHRHGEHNFEDEEDNEAL